MDDKVPIVSVNTVELAPTHVFGAGVTWKPLTPLAETLEEYNEGTRYRAPIVGEDEIQYVKKRNYGETIDRPPFIGCYDRELLNRFKQRRIDPVTKKR